ncbi:MAG: NAD(P)/FAD-dependent oxidoreductase [Acidobacteriia bacterium]|nr:NAD(P)/FAD-dependent oxidoreductase [Terriglobia bacterium]
MVKAQVTAIIGGGPAGAVTAEALAKGGVRTLVFEEKLGWEKPCGGGLSYKALKRYPFLGEATGHGKQVADIEFIAPSGDRVRLHLRSPLAIYSRATLNHLLLSRAEAAGARVIPDRVLHFRRLGSGWELSCRTGTYRADFLVLASGARTRLRALLVEDFAWRDFMLTFGYYVPGEDDLLRIQFFQDLEGYAWAFPRPDHLSVGICAKVGEDRMAGLRERLHGFMRAFNYGTEHATIYSHLLPSLTEESWSNLRLAGQGWGLVGDAAGLVDPVTGEGIYYAMRSGELFAHAMLENSPGLYPDLVRQEFGRTMTHGAQLARLFYRGDFLGDANTTRLIQFAARTKTIKNLLQDLIDGTQSYAGLGLRFYRGLVASIWEMATGFVDQSPRPPRPA